MIALMSFLLILIPDLAKFFSKIVPSLCVAMHLLENYRNYFSYMRRI